MVIDKNSASIVATRKATLGEFIAALLLSRVKQAMKRNAHEVAEGQNMCQILAAKAVIIAGF